MSGPKPFDRPEESGSGRLLTILLVIAAIGGALWLFLGQGKQSYAPAVERHRSVTIDGQRWICSPNEPAMVIE